MGKQQKAKGSPRPITTNNNSDDWMSNLVSSSLKTNDVGGMGVNEQRKREGKKSKKVKVKELQVAEERKEKKAVERNEKKKKKRKRGDNSDKNVASASRSSDSGLTISNLNSYIRAQCPSPDSSTTAVSTSDTAEPAPRKKNHPPPLTPSSASYNGQGLTHPSVFLEFSDPSFIPLFHQSFDEHIEGFGGKVKNMGGERKKRQEGMLWKNFSSDSKKKVVKGKGKGSKKNANLTADERVELMLKDL